MTITMSEAVNAYNKGNDSGEGYEAAGETIDEAVETMVAKGGKLVLDRNTSDDVAVVESASGKLVAIGGDAQGRNAWAVSI